jgi:UDP-3-O-[3-hydroxymyristoyl] glucosamine N-acyltransferase
VVGDNVTIGAGSVVKRGSIIDDNTIIGCNTIIGSEGFQLVTESGRTPMHITHVGRCHICSNVYIGDNTCVCNSLFEGETYVGAGTKIDNLVHVAHNIFIGQNAVITAGCILSGSSVIEDEAWIGPNASILNRVVVGTGAKVGIGAVVIKGVAPYTTVFGNPAKVLKITSVEE